MNRVLLSFFLVVGLISSSVQAENYDLLIKLDYINKNPSNDMSKLFGVHSVLWTTQSDLLGSNGKFNEKAVDGLRQSGVSIIRNGGGVNEINWKYCVGEKSNRISQKIVRWGNSINCYFGPDEYENLNDRLGVDSSWYLANIVGYEFKQLDVSKLVEPAKKFAAYVKSIAHNRTRYWELGNELADGEQKWSADKIIYRSIKIAAAIRSVDSDAVIVVPLISFTPSWMYSDYKHNKTIISALTKSNSLIKDFSLHTYYDNPPEGPSVRNRLEKVRQISDMLASVPDGVADSDYGIWISEHSRWPTQNGTSDWASNWYQAVNKDAVISTADYIIGLSQIPNVKGAMWHALRGFDWSFIGSGNESFRLSNIALLFKFLNSNLISYRAVASTVNHGYFEKDELGNPLVRASALYNGKCLKVWAVNRASTNSNLSLSLVGFDRPFSQYWDASILYAGHTNSTSIDKAGVTVGFANSSSEGQINLPPESVVSATSCHISE